jgi:hypothetical protein
MLRAPDLARVEIVTVLLFRLGLAAQLRHMLLLAILCAARKPQDGRKQRQSSAHGNSRVSPHERGG